MIVVAGQTSWAKVVASLEIIEHIIFVIESFALDSRACHNFDFVDSPSLALRADILFAFLTNGPPTITAIVTVVVVLKSSLAVYTALV
jgi:hypothetical protein